MVIEKLVLKGCATYLAYVMDVNVDNSTIESIQIVREFPNVFLEELSRLPSNRKVK